jgi:hypothetical protein
MRRWYRWAILASFFYMFNPDGSRRWPWKIRNIHDWLLADARHSIHSAVAIP